MRLISLVFALVIIAALIVYYKNSVLPADKTNPDQTVQEQTKQIIDESKRATEQMQKALDDQNRRMQELEDK